MKTTKKNILGTALALSIAFAASLPDTASAADEMKPMKGGEHQMMLSKVETKAQVEALKPGDTFAMVCAKCQTVYVRRVTQNKKGAQLLGVLGGRGRGGQVDAKADQARSEIIATHGCAGCNSTMEVTGHGKGKDIVLKHSCKACGDESAFCCATKPGSAPTEGMKKEKDKEEGKE